MKASDFDNQFDSGRDITEHLDLTKSKRPGLAAKRVNVDFPEWIVASLDKEAHRLGITRQSLIKLWVAAKLDRRQRGLGDR